MNNTQTTPQCLSTGLNAIKNAKQNAAAPMIRLSSRQAHGSRISQERRALLPKLSARRGTSDIKAILSEDPTDSEYLTDNHVDRAMLTWSDSVCDTVDDGRCSVLTQALYRDRTEPEFLQTVHEIMVSTESLLMENPKYFDVFQRMIEPERVITFRVPWVDDNGRTHVNRGFRVQMSSTLGPYKGGLRFHPTVNLSILKFLAFEQLFKNALTGVSLGAGKGGADFDPKGKSDTEVMRFCQSFMTELCKHIGPGVDVPAGDIGVGGREIGYLYGQYKRLTGRFEGALTGKGPTWGGSHIRPEATGYGAVYFSEHMMRGAGHVKGLEGMRAAISGSGNVAQFAAEKLLDLGATPMTFSDSGGTLYCETGFTRDHLALIQDLKNNKRGRLSAIADVPEFTYLPESTPWGMSCDVAFPCATQNELKAEDAQNLVANGCMAVVEGANMPTTPEAYQCLKESGVLFGPAKAANAGGVGVSGLEMAQNSGGLSWTREEVDSQLKDMMKNIYDETSAAALRVGQPNDLRTGADVAAFLRVADAMIDQGCV
ncbi:hypothetical protein CYMTET_10965 [Cymbomonas tetramitiformis]|uniref:glutamate dehydrogenase (NADP(+)) n=1 Tax=Cymbomonas tetramitiformis TaxID=36881 RepID=A0AAE0GN30_9CHLO|nr:hypothetical protein CYMTET_10965 [Cymbomonas tetramitiformis]